MAYIPNNENKAKRCGIRTEEAISRVQTLSPSIRRVQDKVEKASETAILRGALSTHRIYDLSITESVRRERKEWSNKIVQKYREIYGNQARRDIKLDEEGEWEVVNMRDMREQKKWRKKWPKIMDELVIISTQTLSRLN